MLLRRVFHLLCLHGCLLWQMNGWKWLQIISCEKFDVLFKFCVLTSTVSWFVPGVCVGVFFFTATCFALSSSLAANKLSPIFSSSFFVKPQKKTHNKLYFWYCDYIHLNYVQILSWDIYRFRIGWQCQVFPYVSCWLLLLCRVFHLLSQNVCLLWQMNGWKWLQIISCEKFDVLFKFCVLTSTVSWFVPGVCVGVFFFTATCFALSFSLAANKLSPIFWSSFFVKPQNKIHNKLYFWYCDYIHFLSCKFWAETFTVSESDDSARSSIMFPIGFCCFADCATSFIGSLVAWDKWMIEKGFK